MRIRIPYFDGCPHWEPTLALVRAVVGRARVDHTIECVQVDSPVEAARFRFLGSPTVQIDGRDIEPSARDRTEFVLGCRLYGGAGVPSADLIRAATHEASS